MDEKTNINNDEYQNILEYKQYCDIWLELQKNNITYKLKYQIYIKKNRELMCCGYRYETEPNIVLYDTKQKCYLSASQITDIFNLQNYLDSSTMSSEIQGSTTFDLNSVLQIINLRTELSKKLNSEIANYDNKPNNTSIKMGWFLKLWYLLLACCLGLDFILCFTIYWIFYIPSLIPILGSSSINHLIGMTNKRRKSIKSCLNYLQNYLNLKEKLKSGELIKMYGPQYKISILASKIKFYTRISRIFFDLIIGIFVMALAYFYYADVLKMLHTFGARLHIDRLRSNVDWLMGFPSGFKPNIELDQFVGKLLLQIFDYWYFSSII